MLRLTPPLAVLPLLAGTLLLALAGCGGEAPAPAPGAGTKGSADVAGEDVAGQDRGAEPPRSAVLAIVVDHKKVAAVELDTLTKKTPLSAFLPKANRDPASWARLLVKAKDGVSWRRGNPTKSSPGHTTWLSLGEAGTPSFHFLPAAESKGGRPVSIPNVEVVEILTRAGAERSFAERLKENLTLRVTDETGTQTKLDLTSIQTAKGLPSQTGRRHRQPGGSARESAPGVNRSWWVKDVIERARSGSQPVGLELVASSGETITISAKDLGAPSPQRLLHVNRRGLLMYRELVGGKRTRQLADVTALVLRSP